MARDAPPSETSDFEAQRLANIAERDALLKKLQQEAHQAGLFTKIPSRTSSSSTTKKKAKLPQRVKKEEDYAPRRTSSRLAGVQADSEVAKRKADDAYEAAKEVERVKRLRVSGDLSFGDIAVNGRVNGTNLLGTDVLLKGVAEPYKRTFGDDEVKGTSDKDLKKLRERMNGLSLWDAWEPNRIKITPERIYSMAFHPTPSKPLVFAGDKLGNLGIIDASQKGVQVVKEEEDADEKDVKVRKPSPPSPEAKDEDEDEDEDDDPDPVITTIKPHTLATEIYGPADKTSDEPLSGIDMSASDPNILYFTTLNGFLGRHDTRAGIASTEFYQLSEKKIGGFSLNPSAPSYVATASLDRTMKLWDLRKITKSLPVCVGEHESRLSVSHAAFNGAGQVATSSYDDSVKIYSFGVGKAKKEGMARMETWKAGTQLDESIMKPETVVRHNCQTGRWVTILRPQWQRAPQDGHQRFVIGNMNRFVDIYSASGQQLAQLGGDGNGITAVPAVAMFHPTMDWVAGGTASGKLCLWM